MRVLYSFPHKIGAARICDTAWHQVAGAAAAGADVRVVAGAVHRPLPGGVRTQTTLARGAVRIPYRVLGRERATALHDELVARALPRLAGEVDVVHTWPLGARRTLLAARRLGIPTVLERPNAHTRFAYEVVAEECERLGVSLPPDHEHAYNAAILRREEEEYALADHLLCPSEFVVRTFAERGVPAHKLLRHTYGYDDRRFHPGDARPQGRGLDVLFVGVCAVRKGVHLALEAWLGSPACRTGRLRIAGEFLPAYAQRLAPLLRHPSVEVLGHRDDVPALMRASDVLVLPSLEEGFGLTCVEAIGSGCVPLVSNACTDVCVDGDNALVHRAGDVDALRRQLTALDADPALLAGLRAGCLRSAPSLTWARAGVRLVEAYGAAVAAAAPAPAAAAAYA